MAIVSTLVGFGDARAASAWPAISPGELAATASPIEADAPGEVLEHKIDIDDRRFPELRSVTEYTRYKIYAPERTEPLTRINLPLTIGTGSSADAKARLTLPNGKSTEFGREAIRERELSRSGSVTIKQKFLTIPGVEPGAIVEFIVTRSAPVSTAVNSMVENYSVQRELFPVRRYEWRCRHPATTEFNLRAFSVSAPNGEFQHDEKARSLVFTVSNLPSVQTEPKVGPRSD